MWSESSSKYGLIVESIIVINEVNLKPWAKRRGEASEASRATLVAQALFYIWNDRPHFSVGIWALFPTQFSEFTCEHQDCIFIIHAPQWSQFKTRSEAKGRSEASEASRAEHMKSKKREDYQYSFIDSILSKLNQQRTLYLGSSRFSWNSQHKLHFEQYP